MVSRHRSGQSRLWTPGDALLIGLILMAAVASIITITRARGSETGTTVLVEVKGNVVNRIPLEDEAGRDYSVSGFIGESTFEVRDGRVRMLTSPCRDKLCVRTGWIDTPGQTIVCLPNRVVLSIEGGKEQGIDTVSH